MLYDFSPGSSGQIALSRVASAGTTIKVLSLGKVNPATGVPDWAKGINHLGQMGWFPFSYIELVSTTAVDSETGIEAMLLAEAERASTARAARIGLGAGRRPHR